MVEKENPVATLAIPDSVMRDLEARAAREKTSVEDLAARLLQDVAKNDRRLERLIDQEFEAECLAEVETGPVPTLEEVRAIMAKLPCSLAAEISAERDER
jgi:hypothetical protein